MADDLFMFLKAEQFDDLALLDFVHHYYAHLIRLVLHVDQVLAVEVEWDAVLCEFEFLG